jgi:hypothetical protein
VGQRQQFSNLGRQPGGERLTGQQQIEMFG